MVQLLGFMDVHAHVCRGMHRLNVREAVAHEIFRLRFF